MAEVEVLLSNLNRKIDACLILLLKATTHDDFKYSLTDKSDLWCNAMDEAVGVVDSIVKDRSRKSGSQSRMTEE